LAGYPLAMEIPVARTKAQPGGHPLREEVVAHHRRQRIVDGAAQVIAKRGYRNVSVADIVKEAAIARSRFYENFSSREDCFFALYEQGASAALQAVGEGCQACDGDFRERVKAGIAALLAYLEADPALARACVVEGPAVGPGINDRFERLIRDFAALLHAGRNGETEDELPATAEETVVGGLYWLLYYALLEERPKRLKSLLPQLTEFALIPFAGAESTRVGATR
jgi:AcrR family transcriptional regulator